MLGKLAALIALRQSSDNGLLLQQLLAGIGAVILLSLTSAFLVSVLIAGAMCLAFNLLIEYGLAPHPAMMVLGVFLIFLLIVLAFAGTHFARKVKETSRQIIATKNPLVHRAYSLVDAFMEGFQGKR